MTTETPVSNYARYMAAPTSHYTNFPLNRCPDPTMYRPVAPWVGRLILPQFADRLPNRGVFFEVHLAPPDHAEFIGTTIQLGWVDDPVVQTRVWGVTRDMRFTQKARNSVSKGVVHPERLDGWLLVGPLESLAGSHPVDDVIVALRGEVTVTAGTTPCLTIEREPVQITGRYVGLVRFEAPATGDAYRVTHFDSHVRAFSGPEENVRLPAVVPDSNGVFPFTNTDIEHSPLNESGWYIWGALDEDGVFVVQAIGPRALFRLQPEEIRSGADSAWRYVHKEMWKDPGTHKGTTSSVLITGQGTETKDAVAGWREHDRALVFHVFGGIGGKKREPAAKALLYWGHFAFGDATVIHEPLANELSFDIVYHQVYTHNVDGLIAGTLHWSRYLGDRQFGWAGIRPTGDILVKWSPFTHSFDFGFSRQSGIDAVIGALEAMAARYRTGDGTGGTYIGAANNCAQDSSAAFYAAIRRLDHDVADRPTIREWAKRNPADAALLHQLLGLGPAIRRRMAPFGSERKDWKYSSETLECSQEASALQGLIRGFQSWRTMLPRLAGETVAREFIDRGADVWVLRTSQIGGNDPDIEPIGVMTL